jgi:cobalt-zinc-cadmium efflux system membrane fusion protein
MIHISRLSTQYPWVLAPIAMAALTACNAAPRAEERSAPAIVRDTALLSTAALHLARFTTETATSQPWVDAWTAPARIVLDPTTTQPLGAIAEGRITRVLVSVGDRVQKGDVLVAIHSHEMVAARSDLSKAQSARSAAETSLALATSNADRAERLYALKALSLADLEQARAARQKAMAARAEAAADLARTMATHEHLAGPGRTPSGGDEHEALIRSPMNGVVVAREAQPGSVVLVGAPLVTVGDPAALLVVMQLPERAIGAARIGSSVRFSVSAYPADRMDARVIRVAPTIDSLTRTVEVQARVLGDATRLRAEMYATAELLGPPGSPALSVPAAALQAMDGDTVVIIAQSRQGGMQIEPARVRVGRRTAERAEIVAGLSAGQRVVAGDAAVARAELLRRRGGP